MASQYRSAEELVRRVIVEPGLKERVTADPVAVLQELATQVTRENPSVESDVWIYRIVVGLIGFTALVAVGGAIWIATIRGSQSVPDILTALGSGAIGALAGLLSPVQFRR
jgi:cytochrome bd-type quinol oxidase subunit 1